MFRGVFVQALSPLRPGSEVQMGQVLASALRRSLGADDSLAWW